MYATIDLPIYLSLLRQHKHRATELEKWTRIPATRIKMVRSRNDLDALRNADVIICTYGILSGNAAVVEAIQRAKYKVGREV